MTFTITREAVACLACHRVTEHETMTPSNPAAPVVRECLACGWVVTR